MILWVANFTLSYVRVDTVDLIVLFCKISVNEVKVAGVHDDDDEDDDDDDDDENDVGEDSDDEDGDDEDDDDDDDEDGDSEDDGIHF